MRASITIRAPLAFSGFGSRRSPVNLAPLVVVLLLSTLFAGAIVAALQPRPLVDLVQASAEGGL